MCHDRVLAQLKLHCRSSEPTWCSLQVQRLSAVKHCHVEWRSSCPSNMRWSCWMTGDTESGWLKEHSIRCVYRMISRDDRPWPEHRERSRTEIIRRVEPYVRGSAASWQQGGWGSHELILRDKALHELWRYVPWHLDSSAHSSPSVDRWDSAQPTIRYLNWPISRRPGAKVLPLSFFEASA